ncbi:alpha/beta fold hydrolase [Nocardioides pantholopis]|uniref:alpha/beta fold hydrolase n=1 Tax=Nocardioides pantholopis TaxID=2483798 RepID=UPI000F096BC0|nr:alpha/beta fold hydrolase [Nocardioides pantholopis]
MDEVRREYVDGPEGQVHVRRAGRPGEGGRPLLCLHLSPGSGRMYEELLAELGAGRFALAPDTPGFGASDPPRDGPAIATYARTMLALLDHYGLPEVDVLGYHTGSKIAVELALAAPDRVRSLILVSAPHYTDEELAAQERQLAVPRRPEPDGSHLVRQFTELVRWAPAGTPLELLQREFAEQQRAGEQAHWGYLAAFAYRHADHLPRVRQPVLLLCPGDDLEEPTLRARDLIATGRFLHLPEWGHQMMVTRTAEVAALVREHSDAS